MMELAIGISNDLIQYIENAGIWTAMILLFFSAMIEYVFPPFPGDTVTLFGAFLIGIGMFPFLPIFASICLGSLLGTAVVYTAGLKLGKPYFVKKNFRFFPVKKLDGLHTWFERWGAWPIAINRFIPAFRAFIILGAGIAGMRFWKVMVFSTASILVWNGLIMLAGWYLGDNWSRLHNFFQTYTIVVITLVSVAVIVFVIVKLRGRKKDGKEAGD